MQARTQFLSDTPARERVVISPERRVKAARVVTAGLPLALAWGVLAFGSNYPWAYWPLMVASAVLGLAATLIGRESLPRITLGALGVTTAAALVQLIPLPSAILRTLSPAGVRVLQSYDLGYSPAFAHALSISGDHTRTGLAFLVALTCVVAGVVRIGSRERIRTFAFAIAALGMTVAFIGIAQRALFTEKIYGFWTPMMGGSPFGPFVNENHFAGWMLMALPLTIGMFTALVNRGMRGVSTGFRARVLWLASSDASKALLVGFAALVMSLSLVLTFSRSGIVAFVVALLIAGVFAFRQATLARRAVVAVFVAMLGVTVVAWVGVDDIIREFAAAERATGAGRLPIWQDTLRIARAFWLTGTGLNTYGVATLFYQTSLPGWHLREAHNEYLQLAAEGGLLLGVPIVLTIVAFALEVRARFKSSLGSSYWIRLGAVTGIIAIALQSLVEFSLQMPGNAVLFAVLCGIALHDGASSSRAMSHS